MTGDILRLSVDRVIPSVTDLFKGKLVNLFVSLISEQSNLGVDNLFSLSNYNGN